MARKPKVKQPKQPANKRRAPARRRAPNALAVVVFLLLAGTAGLGAWLTYGYQSPAADRPGGDGASAVLSVDLSKPGAGGEAAPTTKSPGGANDGVKDGDAGAAQAEAPESKTEPPSAASETAAKDASGSAGGTRPEPPATTTNNGVNEAENEVENEAEKAPAPNARAARPIASGGDAAATKPDTESGADQAKSSPARPGAFTRSGGLRPAPDPALVKSSNDGPLPVVAPDGRTPLQVYARPFKATGRPRIAVVVGSLGLSQATTLAAVQQLPGGVTLAFAPYGRNLQDYVNQARAAGHEVLLQVPMEPMDYPTNDPGPHTLLTSLTINRNLQRLDWLLGRFTGYVGVVNFMGGRFTAAESHLTPILEAIRGRGLMFLDARASSASIAMEIAGRIGLDVAASDRIVDLTASRDAIDARLLELERLALASGGAIGIGFPYPVTIERLAIWTRAMGDRGFDLAPVSALASRGGKP